MEPQIDCAGCKIRYGLLAGRLAAEVYLVRGELRPALGHRIYWDAVGQGYRIALCSATPRIPDTARPARRRQTANPQH